MIMSCVGEARQAAGEQGDLGLEADPVTAVLRSCSRTRVLLNREPREASKGGPGRNSGW